MKIHRFSKELGLWPCENTWFFNEMKLRFCWRRPMDKIITVYIVICGVWEETHVKIHSF